MTITPSRDGPCVSNLADLGQQQDMKDAEAILDFLATARRHPGTTRPGFSRSLVEQIWQTKRLLALPGGYGYKHLIYRRALPWSAQAVERERAVVRVGRGLILEHVIPANLAIAQVVAATTRQDVVQVLRRDLVLAVITKEENARLNELGLGRAHPDPTRPWSRYDTAGIAVQPFTA